MVTVVNSVGNMFLLLLNVKETSARLAGLRVFVPLKIIFSIFSERKVFVLCSPNTHRIASTTLDLPQPLGPTIAVTPSLKFIVILSPKLLNPLISSLVSSIHLAFVITYENKDKKTERVGQFYTFLEISTFHSGIVIYSLTTLIFGVYFLSWRIKH